MLMDDCECSSINQNSEFECGSQIKEGSSVVY